MATNRAPAHTWRARQANVYLARASEIGFGSTSTLSGSFANSGVFIDAGMKNITITPPETGWEKVDLMGEDANGFQNALMDPKPPGIATVTGTLLLGDDELVEDYMTSGTVTGASGFTRYQIGRTSQTSASADLAICLEIVDSDAGDAVMFAMDNAHVSKWGDVRVSGADGHFEQDITIVCLPRDFYWEFKN